MIIVRVYDVIAIFGNEMKLTTMKIKEILDDWTNKGNEALMQRAHMNHESLHYGWTDYEKNKKNSISRRTIERCIEGDRFGEAHFGMIYVLLLLTRDMDLSTCRYC